MRLLQYIDVLLAEEVGGSKYRRISLADPRQEIIANYLTTTCICTMQNTTEKAGRKRRWGELMKAGRVFRVGHRLLHLMALLRISVITHPFPPYFTLAPSLKATKLGAEHTSQRTGAGASCCIALFLATQVGFN